MSDIAPIKEITEDNPDSMVEEFMHTPVRVFLRNNGVLSGRITKLKNHAILVESRIEGKSAWANLDFVISISRT